MDDGNSLIQLLILAALIIMSAFFSATETAFTSLNRIRLKNKAENGDLKAEKTLLLAEQYDKLLSSTLIGNNIVNNAATTLSTLLFIRLLGTAKGPAVSTLAITVVILIFGEITPKSLAKESPERFAEFAAPMVQFTMFILTPVSYLFARWKQFLSRMFKNNDEEGINEKELLTLVDQAESEGGLDADESRLIRAAIEFNDLEVREILTPRIALVSLSEDASAEDVANLFQESGYSRIPVYRDTIDNIIGVIHEKDFYRSLYKGEVSLPDIISPVVYTLGNTQISDLLRILQADKMHIAVVVDEYGGTEGIVTLEDILEELVGEIWDEYDEVIEEFITLPDGSCAIAGSANVSDMFEMFSINSEYNSSTVSGWVMERLERVPQEGDRFAADGLDVTVTQVQEHRVLEIVVRKVDNPADTADDG